jgi:hypothetical protein
MPFNPGPEAYSTLDHWLTAVLSIGLVLLTVLFHYEALRIFTRFLALPGRLPRIRILYLVLGLFFLHTLEIMIFAVAFQTLYAIGLGELLGLENQQFFAYFYYSAVVYTTLGFGDILPLGPAKILTGFEALIGLGFITWSASFTFLEMQRYWRDDPQREHRKMGKNHTQEP